MKKTGTSAALAATMLLMMAAGEIGEAAGTSGQSTAPPDDVAPYCVAELAIETVGEPEIDWDNLSEEEIAAATQAWVAETIRPLADDVVATAPAELADSVAILSATVDAMIETGDDSVWETPENLAASDVVHEYDLAHCGWNSVAVETVDYAFVGVAAEQQAGTTSFDVTNTGVETHEFVMFRKIDGVTLSALELVSLPEDELDKYLTYVNSAELDPGASDYFVVNLEPGDYVVGCAMPLHGDEDGAPHFMRGMFTEFTVA